MIYRFVKKCEHLLTWLTASRLVVVSGLAGLLYVWIFTPLSVAVALGLVGRYSVALLAILSRVPKAIASLQEEHARTEAEHEAFGRFSKSVADLDCATPEFDPGHPPQQPVGDTMAVTHSETSLGDTNDSLITVREAYRESVMSVSHYECEYADTLRENMGAEFTPELADAVMTGEMLTPQLQQSLLQQSAMARQRRANFLRTLEEERDSVTDARRDFRQVHSRVEQIEDTVGRKSIQELVEYWKRLEDAEDSCKRILAQRQSQIRELTNDGDAVSTHDYLYANHPWMFPVLNDGLETVDRVRDVKRQVISTLSRW